VFFYVSAALAQQAPGLGDRILSLVGPSDPKPLTHKQYFEAYLLDTVGPVPILGEGISAAFSQWRDTPPQWGQGWAAYGKRIGSNLGYNATRQTISYAVGGLTHEDYRYFASQEDRAGRRVRHALISIFLARRPDGSDGFSIAGVSGVVGAAAFSSIWGPQTWKRPRNIAKNAGISFSVSAASNVVREFLPDLLHRPRK
jgi:hypothetical protein